MESEYNDYIKSQHDKAQLLQKDLSNEKEGSLEESLQLQPEQLMPNYDLGEKLNCKGAIINGINTIALMLRMELYVDEHRWKSVNKETQVNLNTVIQCCEEQVS